MRSYNIKFPLRDNASTNTLFQMTEITKDAFSSDLLLLLLTARGERYYEPNYGTNLLKYIFEPNDNLTAADIEEEIKHTVKLYIPNLTITDVKFNWSVDEEGGDVGDHEVSISLKFTYSEDAFSENGELTINF